MSSSPSELIGLEPAPGGLALVQNLLNTWPVGCGKRPDLLAERAAAADWLGSEGLPRAAARELDALRALRAGVRELVTSAHPTPLVPPAPPECPESAVTAAAHPRELPARLVIAADGGARLAPAGEGAERVASAVWLAIAEAQQSARSPEDGQWERLKLCRNPECGSAFYDRSRNNSRVWHDVATCGNAANLRAYRERHRAAR
ncbi:MAG TPA: CGNR zinc finger domain-containing protein [Gryllotalpicola sp.]